ncbi:hypothetical protein KVR01_009416 [Diaporthe batatas]|uniref:uncharacterized protein n=1 Tax=Diaporthe batatas TaxID=748121 RepID=UPI001D0537A4|nr:uncharacterized protein KVR01_009416 [Diaporthe batatas]KAG8161152.1 hypothetical protein KVR01_009416 [Diaporthe batatas]
MAESLGLVSSIAPLAAAGFHVARKISTVADDLGTASAQIMSIAVDIKTVAIILRDIEVKLVEGKRSSRELNEDTRDVLAEVLELCRYEIEDLERNLAPLRGDGQRESTSDIKQIAKWLLQKPKFAARHASFDSLKMKLSLLLHNVQMFGGDRLHEPNVNHSVTPPDQSKVTHAVLVVVSQVNDDHSPPLCQIIDEYQDERPLYGSEHALEEAEQSIVQLNLTEVDDSSSSPITTPRQPLNNPDSTMIQVQEKVRCSAVEETKSRDPREAEKAMQWEAWKERKQAKRAARAAWTQERRAVRA